jgi:hypothetical protein
MGLDSCGQVRVYGQSFNPEPAASASKYYAKITSRVLRLAVRFLRTVACQALLLLH